jgi:WD40 repeat protein
MQLTGKQIEQIHDALLRAFTTKSTLRMMVRIELDENLDAIADGENLTDVVFNLITWGEQHGRIGELIQGAHNRVIGNPKLQQLLTDYQTWVAPPIIMPAAPIAHPDILLLTYSPPPKIADSLFILGEHTDSVTSVVFSPDGTTLVSGSLDEEYSIRLWKVHTGELLTTKPKEDDGLGVAWLAFSPDGSTIARCYDRIVQLWYVRTSNPQHSLEGDNERIRAIAFSPDGYKLAGGCDDHTVRLWDVPTNKQLRALEGHTNVVASVAFNPDGSLLASGSWDHTVLLWDVRKRKQLHLLMGHTESVYSVAFSPDGSTLASGSEDTTICLWDAKSGERLRTLKEHTKPVFSVAFSPGGSILASGSMDTTIRLWDIKSGELLHTLEGHTDIVYSIAFSPDGSILASGSRDSTVRLWRIPPR